MDFIFLEELALNASGELEDLLAGSIVGTLMALIFMFVIVFLFLAIGIYIYSSFAYMVIGKKVKDEKAWLAWIPIVGKPLLTARIAKMHWWPVLFLLSAFLTFIPVVGIFIYYPCVIAFSVFFLIWNWKTYERVGHPGWFALFFLLPLVGYVFLGIVAWSKENIIEPVKKRK